MFFIVSQMAMPGPEHGGSGFDPEEIFRQGRERAFGLRSRLKSDFPEPLKTEDVGLCQEVREMVLTTLGDEMDTNLLMHHYDVAVLSSKIGRKLGLNEDKIRLLHCACILHDIGKMLLDPDFSQKKGRLTEKEYKVIRGHVELSHLLLKDILPEDVLGVVLDHHEDYDGNGYPNGKVNGEINPLGRILRVADSWNAMTQRKWNVGREKNARFTPEQAMAEIVDLGGKAYDPEVVKAFIEVCGTDQVQ